MFQPKGVGGLTVKEAVDGMLHLPAFQFLPDPKETSGPVDTSWVESGLRSGMLVDTVAKGKEAAVHPRRSAVPPAQGAPVPSTSGSKHVTKVRKLDRTRPIAVHFHCCVSISLDSSRLSARKVEARYHKKTKNVKTRETGMKKSRRKHRRSPPP